MSKPEPRGLVEAGVNSAFVTEMLLSGLVPDLRGASPPFRAFAAITTEILRQAQDDTGESRRGTHPCIPSDPPSLFEIWRDSSDSGGEQTGRLYERLIGLPTLHF